LSTAIEVNKLNWAVDGQMLVVGIQDRRFEIKPGDAQRRQQGEISQDEESSEVPLMVKSVIQSKFSR
jgi:hypothetical protein